MNGAHSCTFISYIMIYVENSKTGWAALTYRIHREDTDGQWAPSSVIYKRPGIRWQYDRLRSAEDGCGEEREGLGRRATFQGRGRSNVIETSVRVRANETAGEKGKSKAAGVRVKDLTSRWSFFQGHWGKDVHIGGERAEVWAVCSKRMTRDTEDTFL